MPFRKPSMVEGSIQLLLGACLLFIAYDFATAISADSCSHSNHSAHCYPWGAEGPAAEWWRYASRENYLASSGLIAAVTVIALVLPFVVRHRSQGVFGMTIVVLLGGGSLAILDRILAPG